jgi:uncharacterized protein (DUF1330 family)
MRRAEQSPAMTYYALNLFDLAANDDYLAYSKHSVGAVGKYGGKVVALGHRGDDLLGAETPVRSVIVLVEWPDRAALDGFLHDPELAHLHPLREGGTLNYLWWGYERVDNLRFLKER